MITMRLSSHAYHLWQYNIELKKFSEQRYSNGITWPLGSTNLVSLADDNKTTDSPGESCRYTVATSNLGAFDGDSFFSDQRLAGEEAVSWGTEDWGSTKDGGVHLRDDLGSVVDLKSALAGGGQGKARVGQWSGDGDRGSGEGCS